MARSRLVLAAWLPLIPTACGAEPASPAAATGLPTVEVAFPNASPARLFDKPTPGADRPRLDTVYRDIDGLDRPARTSLRGYSHWHHGSNKPSLRIRPRGDDLDVPRAIELTRPEDALALCNWLPNQLAEGFGLLHEHNQHVRLLIAGVDCGVYLRSLRPGDALAAAGGRARGRWFKGDSLGERAGLDLWASPAAWRSLGAPDPIADSALARLLDALRQPASAKSWHRLEQVLDVDAAARMTAVAALVGSVHADRGHNHVLFFDPATARLEPLLWDANGFGTHVEAELPVDVIRHPLAARLSCNPEFIDRRNRYLHQLLIGQGSANELIAVARDTLTRLTPALRTDPEIGRLRLHYGKFRIQAISPTELPNALAEFEQFVRARDAMLHHWFSDARVAIEVLPSETPASGEDARQPRTRVTVFGNVAVDVHTTDGSLVTRTDGTKVQRLLPGLATRLTEVRQHPGGDRRGVAIPTALPASLSYIIAATPERLRFTNAFTADPVKPQPADTAPQRPTRSVHPWNAEPAPTLVELGPGVVAIDTPTNHGPATRTRILPGTTLVLRAPLRCDGDLELLGTAAAPVRLRVTSPSHPAHDLRAGIRCSGSNVRIRHALIRDERPWPAAVTEPHALLTLGNCQTAITHTRIEDCRGRSILVTGGQAELEHTTIARSHGTALRVTGHARVTLSDTEIAFVRQGVLATDGAHVHWRRGRLHGNRYGVRADRSSAAMPPGRIELEGVACERSGQFDLDCGPGSEIVLIDTAATPNPLVAGTITRGARAEPSQLATPPR